MYIDIYLHIYTFESGKTASQISTFQNIGCYSGPAFARISEFGFLWKLRKLGIGEIVLRANIHSGIWISGNRNSNFHIGEIGRQPFSTPIFFKLRMIDWRNILHIDLRLPTVFRYSMLFYLIFRGRDLMKFDSIRTIHSLLRSNSKGFNRFSRFNRSDLIHSRIKFLKNRVSRTWISWYFSRWIQCWFSFFHFRKKSFSFWELRFGI